METSTVSIWTILTSFITNIFTAIGSVLTSVMGNETLATFVVGIPLFSLAIGLLFKLLSKRAGH